MTKTETKPEIQSVRRLDCTCTRVVKSCSSWYKSPNRLYIYSYRNLVHQVIKKLGYSAYQEESKAENNLLTHCKLFLLEKYQIPQQYLLVSELFPRTILSSVWPLSSGGEMKTVWHTSVAQNSLLYLMYLHGILSPVYIASLLSTVKEIFMLKETPWTCQSDLFDFFHFKILLNLMNSSGMFME